MTLDRTQASAEPRVPSACCRSRWLAAHLVGIASPVRKSGVMGVIVDMRVHAMRVAAAEPRPMPSTFRCLVRVRVWTNVGRWCRRVGAKTCVDRRPACSGRQSPKEPTQHREDEEKRRKETGRRDEERDGNFGCQLYRQRATCGRCDSMAIRSYKERTPHLVKQLQMEMSPTSPSKFHPAFLSPDPPKHTTSGQFQSPIA